MAQTSEAFLFHQLSAHLLTSTKPRHSQVLSLNPSRTSTHPRNQTPPEPIFQTLDPRCLPIKVSHQVNRSFHFTFNHLVNMAVIAHGIAVKVLERLGSRFFQELSSA